MRRLRAGPSILDIAASGQVLETEEAHRTAQRLARIVESHGDAILSVDLRRRVRTWNPAAQRLFGYREPDIIGRPVTLLAPPALRPELLAAVRRAARQGRAELETRRLRRDGRTVYVNVAVAPLRDPRGRLIGFSATLRDVSERRRIEESLQRSELELRAITDAAQDAIILMGNDGRVSFWNRAAEKMFGRTRAQALGRPLHETIGARRHLPAFRKSFARWRRTGRGSVVGNTLEFTGRRRDGAEFPIELSVSSLRLDGRWHAVGIVRDITERKRAEAVLKASEEKFRRLVEDLQRDHFFYRHGRDGVFTYVSPSIKMVLGYTRKEFLTHYSEYLTENRVNQEVVVRSNRSIRGERQPPYLVEIFHKDGSRHWLRVVETPVRDAAGRVTAVEGLAQDITGRLRAEAALRESEAKYRTLFQNSVDGIVAADAASGRFLFANPALCRMIGYRETELLRLSVRDIHPPEAVPRALADFAAMSRGTKQFSSDLPCLRKDGSVFYADVSTGRLTVGGRACLMAIFRDSTERKRAAEAVRESENRYRTLFESAADGILLMRVDGGELIANAAFARMHGYRSPRELVHLRLSDLDAPESARLAPQRLRRLRAGERLSFEVEHRRKDGSLFPLQVTCNLIRIAGESFFLGFHRDITERRRAEAALHDSEARFRTLIDSSPLAISVLRAGRIALVNRAFLGLYGFRCAGQVIGRTPYFLVAKECVAAMRAQHRRRLAGGVVPSSFETVARRKDGSTFPVAMQVGSLLLPEGPAVLCHFTDITARKRGEKELQSMHSRIAAAQETERRRLSRDLHDGVGQILSGAKYSLHSLAAELAAVAPRGSRRALKVADLLDRAVAEVRRVSWNLMPPELESMGLAAAVRTHCREFSARWGVAVTVDCGALPGKCGPELSLALFRITQEALANVAAHSRAAHAAVRLQRQGRQLALSIVDDGTGFVLKRRAHRQGLRGAGLANIQERAESFGGALALFSAPGQGTQLTVRLPLTKV